MVVVNLVVVTGVVVDVVDVEKALQLSIATDSPVSLLGRLDRPGDRHPL